MPGGEGAEMRIALHWFRRDLRLTDNTALAAATAAMDAVLPVVILSDEDLDPLFAAPARVAAMAGALEDIAARLALGGGPKLIVRVGETGAELARLAREVGAQAVYANRSEGARAEAVERSAERALRPAGVALRLYDDLGALPPDALSTVEGRPYTVYTPYARRWRDALASAPPSERSLRRESLLAAVPLARDVPSADIAQTLTRRGYDLARWTPRWGGGRTAALARLRTFLADDLVDYIERRNLPAEVGTSLLSVALRWGMVSAREAWRAAQARAASDPAARAGAETWTGELAWADFYRAILRHFPASERAAFRPAFAHLVWEGRDEHIAAWTEGRTGYPIVDAGMRQLLLEGWMHNRVRMIVASFLVKDLLLDWRLGERHFMRHLADGAVSANVGNWQWAASTGTDAQPWFRIFNPTTQGQRFDPTGAYIRRYVPELARAPDGVIHQPWKLDPAEQRRLGVRIGGDYPGPIVDHAIQRSRALAMYKAATAQRGADAPTDG